MEVVTYSPPKAEGYQKTYELLDGVQYLPGIRTTVKEGYNALGYVWEYASRIVLGNSSTHGGFTCAADFR